MLPLIVLTILTLLTWAVAIWATMEEEEPVSRQGEDLARGDSDQPTDWRNAA